MEQGRLPQFGSKYIRVFDFVKGARRAEVCPKIVGQLQAVVLQGGRARQNQDTPARGARALRLFRIQGNCEQSPRISGRPPRAAPGFGPREGRGGFGPARSPSPSPEAPRRRSGKPAQPTAGRLVWRWIAQVSSAMAAIARPDLPFRTPAAVRGPGIYAAGGLPLTARAIPSICSG